MSPEQADGLIAGVAQVGTRVVIKCSAGPYATGGMRGVVISIGTGIRGSPYALVLLDNPEGHSGDFASFGSNHRVPGVITRESAIPNAQRFFTKEGRLKAKYKHRFWYIDQAHHSVGSAVVDFEEWEFESFNDERKAP